jgi:DNA-binding NarL/FixJ family response regulator
VVVGEDDVLFRAGIALLLAEAGFDVAAQAGDARDFLRKALAHHPEVAVVDIQMPPGRGDDGLQAALELRRRLPGTGVLLLSKHYEEHYAVDLIGDSAAGVGYLLKERVGDVEVFTDAVARVAAGGVRSTPRSSGACSVDAPRTRHSINSPPVSVRSLPSLQRANPTRASPPPVSSPKPLWRNTSATSSISSDSTPAQPNTAAFAPQSPICATPPELTDGSILPVVVGHSCLGDRSPPE